MFKKTIQNVVSKIASSMLMAYAVISQAACIPVYAADVVGANPGDDSGDVSGGYAWVEKLAVNGGTDAIDSVEYILGVLLKVCELFGGVIMLWGIINWVMAMKNEDAGSKQKAIMATITGIILFTFKSILQGAGIIA